MGLCVLYHQNVHSQGKCYLLAMDNVFFKAKKCVKNAFSGNLEIQIYWLSKQNSKKNLNLWEKTAVDKSAWRKAWLYLVWSFQFLQDFCTFVWHKATKTHRGTKTHTIIFIWLPVSRKIAITFVLEGILSWNF